MNKIIALLLLLLALPASAQQLNISVVPTVSATAAKGLVLKPAPGLVYSAYATNATATGGFLVLINATAVPSDGAITPLLCVPLPANGSVSVNYAPTPPVRMTTGIVLAATSNASCFTLTTGTITAFFGGMIQ